MKHARKSGMGPKCERNSFGKPAHIAKPTAVNPDQSELWPGLWARALEFGKRLHVWLGGGK